MKFSALLALATAITSASAGCSYISGNYYCSETSKIIYENVGFSGAYNDVTNMDESSGSCSSSSLSFSGNLSPLDEELSVHFRGPIKLLQFGVYYQSTSGSAKKKRDDDDDCTTTQHVHHKHAKRATAVVVETVVVDQYGNPITGSSTSTTTPTTATASTAAAIKESAASAAASAGLSSSSAAASSSSSSGSVAAGDWERVAYYTPGSTDNCTFLNHYGGSGSGVWSSAFGNSLSYANSDNSGAASSATPLGDVTVGSNSEYVIMSGVKCTDTLIGNCGYYRDGTVAYHGFGGNTKIFVFEFEMPSDGSTGTNGDMPAVWLLNAKIPRTLQYGDASCSCWTTGCGELDLFEVLTSGLDYLITHLHDEQGTGTQYGGGGSSDYFSRPTSGSLKAAVVFTGTAIHILEVTDDFGSTLSSSTVDSWVSQSGSVVTIAS